MKKTQIVCVWMVLLTRVVLRISFGDWNYTNWQDAADMPSDSLSFMYVDAVSMQWSWASSYTNIVDSFVCEERSLPHFNFPSHICVA